MNQHELQCVIGHAQAHVFTNQMASLPTKPSRFCSVSGLSQRILDDALNWEPFDMDHMHLIAGRAIDLTCLGRVFRCHYAQSSPLFLAMYTSSPVLSIQIQDT